MEDEDDPPTPTPTVSRKHFRLTLCIPLFLVLLCFALAAIALVASRPACAQTLPRPQNLHICGVLTTIFPPTAAVYAFLYQPGNFHLVVVGDEKTDDGPWLELSHRWAGRVTYLSAGDQKDACFPFRNLAQNLPYNHFGQKNIGYVWAIRLGAEWIFDFDDDNILLGSLAKQVQARPTPVINASGLWNPYPYFIPVDSANKPKFAWPRGFPLEAIRAAATYKNTLSAQQSGEIGVVQSLADQDPDVDAIYRLTSPDASLVFRRKAARVAVPTKTFAPWNAQATLIHRRAAWGLMLPCSVPGRVSDIVRSYIAERIMWDLGFFVVFSSSFVSQSRNAHSYRKDFDDEQALYGVSLRNALVRLGSFARSGKLNDIATVFPHLVSELVGVGLLGDSDYRLASVWTHALMEAGYTFPPFQISMRPPPGFLDPLTAAGTTFTGKTPLKRVALVLKFNYATKVDTVVDLVWLWSPIFSNIVVVGPFNSSTMKALREVGIVARGCKADLGYYSPYLAFADAISEASLDVDGFWYMHDDTLISIYNIPFITKFNLSRPMFSRCNAISKSWSWRNRTDGLPAVQNAIKQQSFRHRWGKPCFGNFDFAYVPVGAAKLFVDGVTWLRNLKPQIFLELAGPMLFKYTLTDAISLAAEYCTDWSKCRKSGECMAKKCLGRLVATPIKYNLLGAIKFRKLYKLYVSGPLS